MSLLDLGLCHLVDHPLTFLWSHLVIPLFVCLVFSFGYCSFCLCSGSYTPPSVRFHPASAISWMHPPSFSLLHLFIPPPGLPLQVFPSFGGSTYLFCCPHDDDFLKSFPTFFCISVCLQLVFLFHFVSVFRHFFSLQSPELNPLLSGPMFASFVPRTAYSSRCWDTTSSPGITWQSRISFRSALRVMMKSICELFPPLL